MNCVVLVVDRLHQGYLGAYGNTWIETPAIDRLASESFVFDSALGDSPQLGRIYRSYWHGLHSMCTRPAAEENRPSLPALLRAAGVATTLMTDEPQVADHPLTVDFDELVRIEPAWQPRVADQLDQTQLARSFVEAIEWFESAREPFLLWCHLAAMGTTWDAPRDFRSIAWEEGDPEPYAAAEPPERLLPERFDPDEAWANTLAYAGQVSVLDSCLGALLEFFRGSELARNTLLVLTSPRGYPLGEHRRLGPCDDALYGELLHAPLMLRFPDGLGALARSPALVEPSDLWATLLDWWQVGDRPRSPTGGSLLPIVRQEAVGLRDRLCIQGHQQRAIRTPAWFMRQAAASELFAKPDDRWEVNDVTVRCQEIVECLGDTITEFDQTVQHGSLGDLPPLSDVLLNGLD
jgi:arylsulfatase A-like enzyme